MNASTNPLVVLFLGDLMWATKIENAVRRLGYRVAQVDSVDSLGAPIVGEQPNLPGEPVFGSEAMLADKITAWQPALLIFDLDYKELPWRRWIALLKSSPATRQIPVLGFAPHEDVDVIADARQLGTDIVVGRSFFSSNMPKLIEENARVWDHESIALDCQAPLSDTALSGLAAFNQGDFFESHELLEDAWNEDEGAARDIYKAVLQVAVAYLQIERGNYPGAVKMFLRARQWLSPLPDTCRGIDISRLRSDAENAYEVLIEFGPERIAEIDRSFFRPVLFIRESS
jgi:predicted metal-dependent hydrolase